MYTTFSVDGYRGLGRLTLPHLSPVTIVTGRNDVGKSALLEAMFLHGCGPTAGLAALTVLRPLRGLPPFSTDTQGRLNYPWLPFFPGMDLDRTISLTGKVAGERRHLRLTVPRQSHVVTAGHTGGPPVEAEATLDVTTDGRGGPRTYRQTAAPETNGSMRLTSDPADTRPWYDARIVKGPGAVPVDEAFSALRRAGRDSQLVDVLRAVDQRVDGVELLHSDGASMLHARLRDGGLMPFSSLGDGLNSAMTYLLATSSSRGGLVLIDEVEEGLHHSALVGVWRSLVAAAGAGGTQLMVSTHSEEAIAAAVEAVEDRIEDLTLVRLRVAEVGNRSDGTERTSPIEAVTYRGEEVADAVELAVEVR